MRQAIHSLVGSEEPSYMFEEQKAPVEADADDDGRVNGRRLPNMWTRVISLSHDNIDDLKVYAVHQDLAVAEAMVRAPPRRQKPGYGEPTFWPDDYLDGRTVDSLDRYTLSEAQQKKYGKAITRLRKRLREDAHRAAKDDYQPDLDLDQKYLCNLLRRMHQGYFLPEKPSEAH